MGDNIFERINIPKHALEDNNAYVFIKKVKDPKRFGVPIFGKNKKIIKIEEKPKTPKSDFAVTGFYIYPNDVFDYIITLKPSKRGELEITDVSNWYICQGKLNAIKVRGFWSDAGTFESLLTATLLNAKKKGVKAIY